MNLEGKVRRNPRGSQESPGNVESDYCARTIVPRPVCASWHFLGSRPATRDVAWRGVEGFGSFLSIPWGQLSTTNGRRQA